MGRKAKEPTSSRSYRFPDRIIAAFEKLAEDNRRSTNGELLLAIENHLKAAGRMPEPYVPPPPAPKAKKPKK